MDRQPLWPNYGLGSHIMAYNLESIKYQKICHNHKASFLALPNPIDTVG